MSLLSIVWQATWLVKFLLLGLILVSGWAWAFFLAKTWLLRGLNQLLETAENQMRHTQPHRWIETQPQDPASALLFFLCQEWKTECSVYPSAQTNKTSPLSAYEASKSFVDRLNGIAELTMAREMIEIEYGLAYLASVGSITPFVGLLGTVWGLLHSFQQMMASQSMNLASVAPALSEALFATAVGFFVAIPAVLCYNTLVAQMQAYRQRLTLFSQELILFLSNQHPLISPTSGTQESLQ